MDWLSYEANLHGVLYKKRPPPVSSQMVYNNRPSGVWRTSGGVVAKWLEHTTFNGNNLGYSLLAAVSIRWPIRQTNNNSHGCIVKYLASEKQ